VFFNSKLQINREKKTDECSMAREEVHLPKEVREEGRSRELTKDTKEAAEKRRGEGINPHMGDGEYC